MRSIILSAFFIALSIQAWSQKQSIAVLNLEAKNTEAEKAELISERISIELFKSGSFTVIERERLSQLSKEQQLQLSGLTGSEYTSRLGEYLSAELLLLGSIYHIEDLYIINIRILDVESGQYVKVADQQENSFSKLYSNIPAIIRELLGSSAVQGENGFNLDKSIQFIKKTISEGREGDLGVRLEDKIEKLTQMIENQTDSGDITQSGEKQSEDLPQKKQSKRKGPLLDLIVDTKYHFSPFQYEKYGLNGQFFAVGGAVLFNITPLFSLGLAGHNAFLMNEFNTQYNINLAYGGIQGRFKVNIWRFGLGASLIGGVSTISITEYTNVSNPVLIDRDISTTIFLEGRGTVSFSVTEWLAIGANVSYLWSSQYDAGEDLQGINAGISLIFSI